MNRNILITASVLGFIAVVLGAFGAHGLKAVLAPKDIENWKTAVSYQFYHTLALLFLSIIPVKNKIINVVHWCFTLGVVLFSGSIYLLSTRVITGIDWPFLGPVTPIGGLLFIVGWLGLLILAIKKSDARV